MSPARRSLLTATAAGSLLGALWFVPSATATGEREGRVDAAAAASADRARSAQDDRAQDQSPNGIQAQTQTTDTEALAQPAAPAPDGVRLAETGSTDTTPYLAGGLTFLISGVGIYALSRRRVVGG